MDLREFFKSWEEATGLVSHLGIGFDVKDHEIVCHMTVEEHHTGAPNVSHGGTVMSLLDTALGANALAYALERGCLTSTVEMKINLLRPAKQGYDLTTCTEILSAGKSLLVLTATAKRSGTDDAIAFAVGTFNLYGKSTPKDFKNFWINR